jgi:hypothetical protein
MISGLTCFSDDKISPEDFAEMPVVVLARYDLLNGVVRLGEASLPVSAGIDGLDGPSREKSGKFRIRFGLIAKLK